MSQERKHGNNPHFLPLFTDLPLTLSIPPLPPPHSTARDKWLLFDLMPPPGCECVWESASCVSVCVSALTYVPRVSIRIHATPRDLLLSQPAPIQVLGDNYIPAPEGSHLAENKRTCACRGSAEEWHNRPPVRRVCRGLIARAASLLRLSVTSSLSYSESWHFIKVQWADENKSMS